MTVLFVQGHLALKVKGLGHLNMALVGTVSVTFTIVQSAPNPQPLIPKPKTPNP